MVGERGGIMQIVIDIDDKLYEIIKDPNKLSTMYHASKCAEAVRNGIPLPKGHGDLIDKDDMRVIELEDSLHIIRHEKGDDVDVYIDAQTIIKEDKGE
jgi:hypothetical protein